MVLLMCGVISSPDQTSEFGLSAGMFTLESPGTFSRLPWRLWFAFLQRSPTFGNQTLNRHLLYMISFTFLVFLSRHFLVSSTPSTKSVSQIRSLHWPSEETISCKEFNIEKLKTKFPLGTKQTLAGLLCDLSLHGSCTGLTYSRSLKPPL